MAVGLPLLKTVFRTSDINGDGKLDRPELAKASLNYLGSDDNQAVGSLFATMVQGGTDKKGLLPDFNNDGGVSFSELQTLAKKSGDKNGIEADDFKSAFTDRFQAGGQDVDQDKLKALAQENDAKFSQDSPDFWNAIAYLLRNNKNSQNGGYDQGSTHSRGNHRGWNNGNGNHVGWGNGSGNQGGYGNGWGNGSGGYGGGYGQQSSQNMLPLFQGMMQMMCMLLQGMSNNGGNNGNYRYSA